MYNYEESVETVREITLRGRMMMLACDIEFSMLCMIMYCNPDPNNHERVGQFKGMRMAGKIECVICDMKKYKESIYNAFKSFFDGLDEFRKVRNDFAHYIGRFEEDGAFRFNYVEKDIVDGVEIEKIAWKKYSETEVSELLDKFSKINGVFFAIWRQLELEFQQSSNKNPFVHLSQDTSDSTY